MGRFISADAFVTTDLTALGSNMFAYCCNNPVVFADSNGYRRTPFEPVCFDGSVGVSPIEEWEEQGVEYQSNGPGKGGKIVNSHLIRDDRDITLYILAIMRDPRYKDDISGTFEGVYYEWIVHNALYDFGVLVKSESIKNKAATLDFGGTIYDDDHGIGSGLMWGFYMMVLPEQAQQDLTTHLLN